MGNSTAKIISWNINNESLCASAAKISTTKGTAIELFETSDDNQKNRSLISKVLESGHLSIIEHAVFSLALENVSAFTEEFFIECRLASFTVKSRRYVDFGGLGYYVPPELAGNELILYRKYMDELFSLYSYLLANGVPKEDARFVLPYAFNSNFYCTINARELINILYNMKYGRCSDIPELRNLAEQILNQTASIFPIINSVLGQMSERSSTEGQVNTSFAPIRRLEFVTESEMGIVEMIQSPSDPVRIIGIAHGYYDPLIPAEVNVQEILKSDRPRELEQLVYMFSVQNISLSGITHIVRHRMQSIIIPPLQKVDYNKVVVPMTIDGNQILRRLYRDKLNGIEMMRNEMIQNLILSKYQYYYALSGNMTNIVTTLSARELIHLIKLRSCNRAQWEIKNIVIQMLANARVNCPDVFKYVGPTCFMNGKCPETRLSCGKQAEVELLFSKL